RPHRRDAGPPGGGRGPARAVFDGGRDEHVEDQHGAVPGGAVAPAGRPHQPERPDGHGRAGGPVRAARPFGTGVRGQGSGVRGQGSGDSPLPPDSRLLTPANDSRPLTPVSQWRWQDGPVVTALKRGWWVLLDEVNLAEPQILERLNSVLERDPMLVLTEHDHSAFGPGGQPIHPDFRLFATMNPAEYSGRSVLSPAY